MMARFRAVVSFDSRPGPRNADLFSGQQLCERVDWGPGPSGANTRSSLIATDGELYGHHRDLSRLTFLRHLLQVAAAATWFPGALGSGEYLRLSPPQRTVRIHDGSSWSCHHGVGRWQENCGCVEGAGDWKVRLRHGL